MAEQATTEAIRKSVTVERPIEDAFRVFTEGIGTWWPVKTHSVGQDRAATAIMECRRGGRIYERQEGGREAVWGEVLAWEPPHRVVFSWHPGREPTTAQEIEVTFGAEGDGTRVELEQRGWERLGARAAETRSQYDAGWDRVLGLYVDVTARGGA